MLPQNRRITAADAGAGLWREGSAM